MMSSWQLLILGCLAFLLFAGMRLPAGLVIGQANEADLFAYGRVEGTVWQGHLRDVSARGYSLGNLTFSLRPFSSLAGSPTADIKLAGGEALGSFRWTQNEGHRIAGLEMIADIRARLGQRPLSGAMRLDGGAFQLDQTGRCTSGSANARTNILDRSLGLDGLVLQGQLTCTGGDITLALQGQALGLMVAIDGELGAAEDVLLRASLTPIADQDIPFDMQQALSSHGFRPQADGSMSATIELDSFL